MTAAFAMLFGLAALSLAIWTYLLFLRGGFWKADQQLGPAGALPAWPAVVAVIPARDEAPTIGRTVNSLLAQDYPGELQVIVVDDGSGDGTAAAAGASARLRVITGAALAEGWTGKLWAVSQGLAAADDWIGEAAYVLLTDADIEHHSENLKELVFKAESGRLDLVSLMVGLHCESFWERILIPAFVFFFQKLYPFPWVNDPARRHAAAAGGCMLVRRRALQAAGGVAAIRGRLIDDCALAGLLKANGPIWLGLSSTTRSLRSYRRLSEIWNMVARTAFVQLEHSAGLLVGTVFGMAVLYLTPPIAAVAGLLSGRTGLELLGAAAWAAMAAAYAPTLRLYGQRSARALWLPVAGLLYALMTVSSALRHWRGRGGAWKGRWYSSDG